jgi:hypothetical protein
MGNLLRPIRPVIQTDKEGNYIQQFASISLAVIHLKSVVIIKNQASAEAAISNCLAGRQKSAFGFKWKS